MPGGFDPKQPYAQVGSDKGQPMFLQGGVIFDINGNVVNPPVPSVPPGSPNVTYAYAPDGITVIGFQGSGNTSAGAVSSIGFIPRISRQYANGQPIPAVSRITNPGKIWYNFIDDTAFTYGGTTTGWSHSTVAGDIGITDSGYAAQGSKTGNPTMVKLAQDGTSNGSAYTVLLTGTVSINLVGKAGLWLYYSPDSTDTTQSLNVQYSVGGSFPGRQSRFDSTLMRVGWNFLPFDDNQNTHPYNLVTAGAHDIIGGTVTKFRLDFTITAGKTAIFYLDSFWTGWTTPVSRILIGKDGNGEADLLTYKTDMDVYGFKGYLNFDCTGSNDMTLLLPYQNGQATGGDARVSTCYTAGWDVINHSVNHNTLAGLTNAQIRYVALAQREYQLANGWIRGSEFFCAALNTSTYAQKQLIKSLGFVAMRGYAGVNMPTLYGFPNLFDIGSDSFDQPRGLGNGAGYLSVWQSRTLGYINYGADLWLNGHNIIAGNGGDPTGNTPTNVLNQIYDNSFQLYLAWLNTYVQAGQAKVVTPTEWYYGLV